MEILGLIIFWLICAAICYQIAEKKESNKFVYFMVGLLFGPLGILMAWSDRGGQIRCPFCREYISKKALICPKCQGNIAALDKP